MPEVRTAFQVPTDGFHFGNTFKNHLYWSPGPFEFSMANAMRFTTSDLAELVEKITLAQDQALTLELALFAELAQAVAASRRSVAATGRAIAELDVASALAVLASEENYCRAEIDAGTGLHIVAGRHPVVEQAMRTGSGEAFVANECIMEEDSHSNAKATSCCRSWGIPSSRVCPGRHSIDCAACACALSNVFASD